MKRRRWGDRRDGRLLRNIDSMHYVMPLMYPNRCDNEAYMTMQVDLKNAESYIRNKSWEGKLTIFEIVIAAALKTIWLRPQMNRFIANKNIYQRNDVTAAFTVKKTFADDGEETLARIEAHKGDTIETLSKKIAQQIHLCKTGVDESTKAMNVIQKIPGKHLIGLIARFLDRHGMMPGAVIASDPYQCSVVLTNLGSIGMNVGYHHLMNWGTNSVFIVVGSKAKRAHFGPEGVASMRRELAVSVTIDERISDGFYYARSLRMLKKLIENPELMELPIEVDKTGLAEVIL
ncbi:2-oxo acid dehydrogenase subunit E2 [Butyrivibrio sp. MC2013]|uniref:2-oxo acid dehydrogenase subunit E2 n=1 Tax=Butyrivibrio sp. MC2013 TaxID=1280686 RepID=UPI000406A58E|nr:2-oxo acid dehydrogenase subunit E2 [Butyrivibrio sp. MC2013]